MEDYPEANEALIDEELEQDMETARRVVELARNVRNETGIKTRQPLSESDRFDWIEGLIWQDMKRSSRKRSMSKEIVQRMMMRIR